MQKFRRNMKKMVKKLVNFGRSNWKPSHPHGSITPPKTESKFFTTNDWCKVFGYIKFSRLGHSVVLFVGSIFCVLLFHSRHLGCKILRVKFPYSMVCDCKPGTEQTSPFCYFCFFTMKTYCILL